MMKGLFHFNSSTISEHMFADIALLQSFQDLRSAVPKQMEKNIQARLDTGNDQFTEFELTIDAFKEEIEPQVWYAVKVMNKKVIKLFHPALQVNTGNANKLTDLFM